MTPYYRALTQMTGGSETNMEAAYGIFRNQTDPERRNHIVALHEEMVDTFPKFTSYGSIRDTLKANLQQLKEAWE